MSTIKDKLYGCLIGGAVGDALGRTTEGMMYWEIREKYGVFTEMIDEGFYGDGKAGEWTDDTTLGSYLAWKFIEKKARLTADDFADVILRKLDPSRFWVNEKLIKERLYWGVAPWDAGIGGIACGCAAMGIAPVGLMNAGNPEQAYQDGMCIATVNSSGENRDMGAMFACSVASALKEGSTIDSVIDDIYRHGNYIVKRAVELTMDLAEQSSDTDDFTERFYEKLADPFYPQPEGLWKKNRFFSANGREYVPVAYALVKLCGDDLTKAITAGANFGRDCDSIASLTGQIGGALYGSESIRKDWIDLVGQRNSSFLQELYGDDTVTSIKDVADRFYEAMKEAAAKEEAHYKRLCQILNEPQQKEF